MNCSRVTYLRKYIPDRVKDALNKNPCVLPMLYELFACHVNQCDTILFIKYTPRTETVFHDIMVIFATMDEHCYYYSPSLPPSLPPSFPPSLPPSFPPSLLPSLPPSLPLSLPLSFSLNVFSIYFNIFLIY